MGRQVYRARERTEQPYRALYISDIHLSNKLPYAKVVDEGVTDRLIDQVKLLRRVFAVAKKSKCEAIYIVGDLFDQNLLDAITLTVSVGVLSESPVPTFFLPGNHDALNPTRGERFTVEAFGKMGIDRFNYLMTGDAIQPRKWLTFWPIEFCPVQETRDHIAAIEFVKGVNVLLMHNSVIGCTHIGWKCDHGLEAEDTEDFDHVISGHFHDPQEFGHNGRYLGAPMHHHFGDVNREAGFWVMDFHSDGTREEKFIDGGAPKFHLFDWPDVEDVDEGDYVRVRVEATHAEMTKMKPAVEECVGDLRSKGIHANWYHKPVYHHVTRIKQIEGSDGVLPLEAMIDEYVEAVDVDTSGLDLKELKRVGNDIFKTVAGTWQG